MDQNEELQLNELEKWADIDCDNVDFDALEEKLEADLEEQLGDLKFLEEEHEKIGNPDTIGDVVLDVVWEQFINQIGVVAGEDFIEENRGLRLDLRKKAHIVTIQNYGQEGVGSHNHIIKSEEFIKNNHEQTLDLSSEAHIQTTENFADGRIATHNHTIDYKKRFDDWHSNLQHDENGNVITHKTRSGRYEATLVKGARAPFDKGRPTGSIERGTDMDHMVSAGEIIRNPATNAHLTKDEQIKFANSDANLHEMNARQNRSKGDNAMTDWLDYPNKNGQRPHEIFEIDEKLDRQYREKDVEARTEYKKVINEGEERSRQTGEQSQKEEEARSIAAGKQSRKEEAIKIRDKALRAVIMGLFASLIKDIVQKLVSWFRSGERKFKSFITSVTDAITVFISNIKQHLKTATNTFVTTVTSAIFGPIIGMLKKAWIFLKQGWKSLKEAVAFLRNPENKQLPFSMKMLQVGKIVIAGLTAGGAILLGEVIEKALMTIPVFAIEIPFLGSLANLLGIFLGALVSGVIGALALNLIDRRISHKLKKQNLSQQHNQRNEILQTQEALLAVSGIQLNKLKAHTAQEIVERHTEAANKAQESEEIHKQTRESLNEVFDILNEV